jgi:hypothetical protein
VKFKSFLTVGLTLLGISIFLPSSTIENVQPNTNYKISVQGCNEGVFLSQSSCSSWSDSEDRSSQKIFLRSIPLYLIKQI